MKPAEKLKITRNNIKNQSIDAFLQPVNDAYLSEYPPASDRRVEWLSGFSGSAGLIAVLADKAALFVDGRYTLQAATEVDPVLFEIHNSANVTLENWLAAQLARGQTVGYDPSLHSMAWVKRLTAQLSEAGIALTPCRNPVDAAWSDRPLPPASPLFIHDSAYAGETSAAKRRAIAEKIQQLGAHVLVMAAPDAICWLLNIRARDVEHTPLALCAALLDEHANVRLFIDPARCSEAVQRHLGTEVTIDPPAELPAQLASLGAKRRRVLCDPSITPAFFIQALSDAGAVLVEKPDPCLLAKACKNPVELQGMRNAHLRDGAALVKLLCWLDAELAQRDVSELDVCDALLSLRSEQPLFLEPSFSTISGSGPNGAIVHYRATPQSNRILRQGELFLLDSGGQYYDGTTDITRTIAIGTPSPEQKERFTRVFKGHIALATARFPEGTNGAQLDALARQHLWQAGLDYDHGTGHGVGHFLSVHEGPQRIGKRGGDVALKPGMILSNEPGYYKTGEYGIRIENLVAVVPAENSTGFLRFETLTCAPIDLTLIEASLLTTNEKQWLNAYHAYIFSQLTSMLSPCERDWLAHQTRPL